MRLPGKQRLEKRVQQFKDWVVDRGTRAFARVFRSAVEDTGEFILPDEESVDVYWFSSESVMLGQVTVFNTILLNRWYFDRLTPEAQNVIVRHELGHANRRPELRVAFFGMVWIAAVGIYALAGAGLLLAFDQPLSTVTSIGGYGAGCVSSFLLVNRIEETTADLQALRALGEDAFIEGHQDISDLVDDMDDVDPSFVTRTWQRLCYPRPETVVRLNRLLERVGITEEDE